METKYKLNILIYALFLSVGFFFSFTNNVYALDITAANCSSVDIQKAIDDIIAQGGGTVNVPECNITWDGTEKVVKNTNIEVRIIGAGQNKTIINKARWQLDGDGIKEIAHMQFNGMGISGCFIDKWRPQTPSSEIRIHHLTIGGYNGSIGMLEGYNGVIDHCIFTAPADSNDYAWYIHHGEHDYENPAPPFGTSDALFIEDNTFDKYYHPVAGFCSARIVFRNNIVTNQYHTIDVHEPGYNYCYWSTDHAEHGGRTIEIYNNTFTNSGTGDCINPRGGAGIITGNTINNFTNGIQLTLDTGSKGELCNISNGCPQEYGFDDNNCGVGDGCCESPKDFWIWDNVFNNVKNQFQNEGGHECLRIDIEYFLRAPSISQDNFSWQPYQYPHPLQGQQATPLDCTTIGDVTCDQKINSSDIQTAVNIFLGINNNADQKNRADLNKDSEVNVLDIQKIINIVLGL